MSVTTTIQLRWQLYKQSAGMMLTTTPTSQQWDKKTIIIIIIIIIKNVLIQVTRSRLTLQGHFTQSRG